MNKECHRNLSSSQLDQPGIYELIKKLSEIFADQHSKSPDTRKKFLSKSYEILLKKGTVTPEGLPSDWDDSDVLNAIKLDICKRCKMKQTWTKDLCDRVINQMEVLYKNKDTEYFQNSVNPVLRMLLCIEYYQQKIPTPEKKVDRFFNTDIISSYLDNIKNFLPKVNVEPSLKFPGIPSSLSDGQIKYFSKGNRFDYIFQIDRQTNDLDEGFVTPNEEHIEKTPCSESHDLPPIEETPHTKFNWDFNVVSVPPSRHKTWEKYYTIGKSCKQPPFIDPTNVVKFWLIKEAPVGVIKISREELLDDLLVLFVGIPSSTFVRNGSSFSLQEGVYMDELTPKALQAISKKFIQTGTSFIALTQLSESSSRFNGEEDAISLAFKFALREHLYKYQTIIISAKEKLCLNETSCFKLITILHPFMEEILGLHSLLFKEPELKGVALLEFLFQLMSRTSNTALYHTLSSLFLLPCMYYFRLLDDWIFFGKWHRDLPMSYSDMNAVVDRPSWVEACKPSPKMIGILPTKDLALCGKSIHLLRMSKNYEKFQLLLESENRPKLKVCLNPEELRILREQCLKYCDEGLQLFSEEEEELLDPVICAHNAALKYTEEFEKKKLQHKIRNIEKKKEELKLREEDLVRSAQNKELKRQEEEAENERITAQYEEILYKEHQQEIEKAKAILEQYKEKIELEEKRIKRAEWKAKRYALNEKRKEFFLSELKKQSDIIVTEIEGNQNMTENLEKVDVSKPTNDNVDIMIDEANEVFIDKPSEANITMSIINNDNMNAVKSTSQSTENESNGNFVQSNLDSNFLAENKTMDFKKENDNELERINDKVSELERNRAKVLGSDIMNDNVEIIAYTDVEGNAEKSDLIKNKNKILGSQFDNKEIYNTVVNNDEKKENLKSEEGYSNLERNRMKILGSDLDNDRGFKLHIWDDETQRNRKNMLDSHIPYVVEYEIEKADLLKKSEEMSRTKKNKETNVKLTTEMSIKEESEGADNEDIIKDSEKISADTQDYDEKRPLRDLDGPYDMNYKKPDWFQRRKSNENIKIKNVFKTRSSSLILKEDIDFTYLNKLVPQSLSTVLEIQMKLVNKALLSMFLNEFELLKVAQKLREYFFLHGEFGKRLTSSLSKAIETEEPSTLLTFYRLRNILAEASREAIKEISFVVNNTPVAFDHSNSQVLSGCLGLTYKFEWPLNLIFTDKAISRYNDVFVYLFALQRVSWHLDKVCYMLQFKSADLKGYHYTQIHLYRYVMSQFINNLRSYIMTTIIENSWQEFVKDVQKVNDIDELYRRHAIYIRDINFKCFLDKRATSLMKEVEKLLHYILVFSRALFFGEWSIKENNEYTHSNFEKLRTTFSSFQSKACLITRHVKKLVRVNYQKELEVLEDFLTMNSFYDS